MTDWGQRLRDGIDAANHGDFDAASESMDENIHWSPRLGAVDTPMLHGKPDVVRLWREQSAALGGVGTFRFEVISTEELGPGTLLSELRASGVGTASGVAVEDHYWAVWSHRGGKVVRVDQYDTREDALRDLD